VINTKVSPGSAGEYLLSSPIVASNSAQPDDFDFTTILLRELTCNLDDYGKKDSIT